MIVTDNRQEGLSDLKLALRTGTKQNLLKLSGIKQPRLLEQNDASRTVVLKCLMYFS